MSIRISYIVPVYNAEQYLKNCIDSIAKQFGNIEIILVNDGSKDGSGAICQEYAEKDSRIKYVYQDNAGVSAARNRGIAEAQGEYIRFVDSDDKICDCDESRIIGESKGADWIVCNGMIADSNDRIFRNVISSQTGILSKNEVLDRISLVDKEISFHYTHNHFYKRDIIIDNKLLFDVNIHLGEDFLFNLAYFKNCQCIYYSEEFIMYDYKRDNESLTGRCRTNELERRQKMDGEFVSLYQELGLYNNNKDILGMIIGRSALSSMSQVGLSNASKHDKKVFLKKYLHSEYYGYLLRFIKSDEYTSRSKEMLYSAVKWRMYSVLIGYFGLYRQR